MLRRREYGLCLSMVAICFPKMTIVMLVWCIWLSVCVSGSDPPPFPVGGLDLPVGTGNPSWCIVCVCPRTPPLAVRVLRAVAQWVAQGHTCGHRLADAACSRQSGACGARRLCYHGFDMWAVMARSDESACEGEEIVSSELRWYGNAGGQGCARQWRAGGGLLLPL